jgi:hypothetical protein
LQAHLVVERAPPALVRHVGVAMDAVSGVAEGRITWMMVPTSGLVLINRLGPFHMARSASAASDRLYYRLDDFGVIVNDQDGRCARQYLLELVSVHVRTFTTRRHIEME